MVGKVMTSVSGHSLVMVAGELPIGTVVEVTVPGVAAPDPGGLSVADILAAAEARRPKEEPVSQQVIEAAKKPPKLKSDISTAPAVAQAASKIIHEDRFDGDMDSLSEEDLESLRNPEPVLPVSRQTGRAISAFDANFDSGREPKEVKPSRRGKPVSIFELG